MENKIKHLEMIQGIISKMGHNSFALKGWGVTLAAGFLGLSDKNADKFFFLIVYLPIALFWFLDSYYLMQERRYIALYNKVRLLKSDDDVDFDMNVDLPEFSCGKNSFSSVLTSKTEIGFYFPFAVIVALIIFLSC